MDDETVIKLIVKLNKAERELVEQKAKSKGLTSSNYVRSLLRADINDGAGKFFKAKGAGRPKETALTVISSSAA